MEQKPRTSMKKPFPVRTNLQWLGINPLLTIATNGYMLIIHLVNSKKFLKSAWFIEGETNA